MPGSVFRNVNGINPISICTVYIYTGQMVENDDETQNLIYIYIDMIGANSLDDNKPTNWLAIWIWIIYSNLGEPHFWPRATWECTTSLEHAQFIPMDSTSLATDPTRSCFHVAKCLARSLTWCNMHRLNSSIGALELLLVGRADWLGPTFGQRNSRFFLSPSEDSEVVALWPYPHRETRTTCVKSVSPRRWQVLSRDWSWTKRQTPFEKTLPERLSNWSPTCWVYSADW